MRLVRRAAEHADDRPASRRNRIPSVAVLEVSARDREGAVMTEQIHRLELVALLVPFVGLSLLVLGLSFGLAWRGWKGSR